MSKRIVIKKAIAAGIGVFVVCMTVAGAEQQRLPLIYGECPNELQAEDVAEIMKLATTKDSSPWLLEAEKTKQSSPVQMRVSAYLKPFVATPRLRRGHMVFFFDVKRPRQETRSWSLGGDKHRYAQVSASNKPFTTEFVFPSPADKPFLVTGNIRDEDLVALVDFIRSYPQQPRRTDVMPDGRIRSTWTMPDCVHGGYPILSVKEKEGGSFEIHTERCEGAGQAVRVKLQNGKWKLLSVSNWYS